MEIATAERRFAFTFEEAIKAKRHESPCICFPCRVYQQYNEKPDNEKLKTAWDLVHDPKNEEMKKIMKAHPEAWVIWNDFIFWVS